MEQTHTIEDLNFLFGRHTEQSKRQSRISIEAENDWLDGKNADANPYPKGSWQNLEWYRVWFNCNKNC